MPTKIHRKKILVVEDDRDIAHLLDLHLKDLCYNVVISNDGEGYVHISSGISGKADLAADTYDWRNPTAKITISRVPVNEHD